MNQTTQALEHASVRQYCKVLRMPVIGSNFVRLSEQAIKEQRSHIGYLEALLTMEAEEEYGAFSKGKNKRRRFLSHQRTGQKNVSASPTVDCVERFLCFVIRGW